MTMTTTASKSVIVIGAGIIGASIAYRLVHSGAKVTLIDAGAVAGGVASPCSFGWINATYGCSRNYYDLRTHSMAEWDVLAKDVPELPYRKCGNLYLHFDRIDLDTFFDAHSAWGYNLNWVGHDEIRKRAPNVVNVPERGLFAPGEAVADAEGVARCLVAHCEAAGADIKPNTEATKLMCDGRQIVGVETLDGSLEADEVVVAAGGATAKIAETAGVQIEMRSPPGLLVHTKPIEKILNPSVLMKGLHAKQNPDGTLVAGADFGGGEVNETPEAGADILIARLRKAFRGAEKIELSNYTVGLRPMPKDGLPLVGRPPNTDGLYVSVMHSGVTLAPSISLLACNEIIEGKRDNLLQSFGFEGRVAPAIA